MWWLRMKTASVRQPGPVSGVLAFGLFGLAATAMVSATLLALYGTAASGVYMIVR
jgi:hypothetical protein